MEEDINVSFSLSVDGGKTYTYTYPWNPYPYEDDYCDCDERCPHCGKKKRRKTWTKPITNWENETDDCSC